MEELLKHSSGVGISFSINQNDVVVQVTISMQTQQPWVFGVKAGPGGSCQAEFTTEH